MTKIFCFIESQIDTEYRVCALMECGTYLCSVLTTPENAQDDIGISTLCFHDLYGNACPSGYELLWISNPYLNKPCLNALKRAGTYA